MHPGLSFLPVAGSKHTGGAGGTSFVKSYHFCKILVLEEDITAQLKLGQKHVFVEKGHLNNGSFPLTEEASCFFPNWPLWAWTTWQMVPLTTKHLFKQHFLGFKHKTLFQTFARLINITSQLVCYVCMSVFYILKCLGSWLVCFVFSFSSRWLSTSRHITTWKTTIVLLSHSNPFNVQFLKLSRRYMHTYYSL